jgi:hypothetical protein
VWRICKLLFWPLVAWFFISRNWIKIMQVMTLMIAFITSHVWFMAYTLYTAIFLGVCYLKRDSYFFKFLDSFEYVLLALIYGAGCFFLTIVISAFTGTMPDGSHAMMITHCNTGC